MENPEIQQVAQETPTLEPRRSSFSALERISRTILLVAIALVPVIVIPSPLFGFGQTKAFILTIGVLLSLSLWLASRLRKGTMELPFNPFIIALVALPVVYLISSIFSHSFSRSLIGRGAEVDTVLFVLLAVLVTLLIPLVARSHRSLIALITWLFAGFLIVGVVQLLRLVLGNDILSLGIFGSNVGNLIGTWNDLGLYAGLFTILSLVTLELPLKRWQKIALYTVLVLSLLYLALVNFNIAWIVVGAFSLLFFIYTLSFGMMYRKSVDGGGEAGFPMRPLVIFAISLLFVIAGGVIGDSISSIFNIVHLEARPSWGVTMNIAEEVLVKNPFFGSGPNTFKYEWFLNKPEGINTTIFWNTEFIMGVGIVPTALVTTGVVGLIAWLAVLFLFLWFGVKTVATWKERQDSWLAYLEITSFLAATYCLVTMLFHVPNLVIVMLGFVFMGIFLAVQWQKGRLQTVAITGSQGPRQAFLVTFVAIGLLVGVVAWGYTVGSRYISSVLYQSGLLAADRGAGLDVVEAKIQRAANLHPRDQYYRSLSQLYQLRLGEVLVQEGLPEDLLRSQFQEILSRSLGYAQLAINNGPKEYENWLMQANIYASLVPLGIEGSYERAQAAYARAVELNPSNPAIDLAQARLEISRNNIEGARQEIGEALEKKNNYTQAVFLLSQIEAQSGNIAQAIQAAQAAALISPNDPTTFFQLGLLYYAEDRYSEAVPVFERAILLVPTYANAKYFLGLSYYQTDRIQDAIGQFEDLEVLNPDNEEVKVILNNLRSGSAPFAGIVPEPQDPIEREELPIEESPVEE